MRWDGSRESRATDNDDPVDRSISWLYVAVCALSLVALAVALWMLTQP